MDGKSSIEFPEGMTRRQKYMRATFGHLVPDQHVDPEFFYLIEWFYELRSYLSEYGDPLTPSFISRELADKYPSNNECVTLIAMDRAQRIARREIASAL